MASSSIAHLIVRSLKHLTKRELFPGITDAAAIQSAVLTAPYVVIAQNAAPDPTLLYANSAASALFGLTGEDVGKLPTRLLGRDERARLPAAAAHSAPRGLFNDAITGVRVSKDASRAFRIKDAIVWQILDFENGNVPRGSAALFSKWDEVPVSAGEAPSAFHVALVNVDVKPEFVDLFRVLSVENARQSMLEPGCVRFDVVQNAEDPANFTFFESFINEAAEKAHKETRHYRVWRDSVAPLMASPRTAKKGSSVWPAPTPSKLR
jgi:quinol monooxygenase YgiN